MNRGTSVATAYLVGDFDMFNVGHLDLLTQAQALCDRIVVGVLSDRDVQTLTGRPPMIPQVERLALVASVRGVDAAVVHAEGSTPIGATVLACNDLYVTEATDSVIRSSRSTSSAMLLASLGHPGGVAA